MTTDPQRNVVAILQARMGSHRLPGKVLASVLNEPMLALIVKRVLPAHSIDQIVIATSCLSSDDVIELLASELGVPCFRGSENDCLDRYYQAAKQFKADVIVRLTGDNPFVDAEFIDWVVQQYLLPNVVCDYIGPSINRTFPVGISAEVFSWSVLEQAWLNAVSSNDREHVTSYIIAHPEQFKIVHLSNHENYSYIRLTIDTSEDLSFAREIYEHFGSNNFSWRDVVQYLIQQPELLEMNRHIRQRQIG
jgi:spore coat polysaccharide biosynthesis protein SpsF